MASHRWAAALCAVSVLTVPVAAQVNECAPGRGEYNYCNNVGDDCIDPNFYITDNWECHCRSPEYGQKNTMAYAYCYKDECAMCGGCENDYCRDAGFGCNDPDLYEYSTGDWQCTCEDPRTGNPSTRAYPRCQIDECTATCPSCENDLCRDASQNCIDVDVDDASLGDWGCLCPAPAQRNGVAYYRQVADCRIDECTYTCNTCAGTTCRDAAPAQDCVDPDDDHLALSDWECRCRAPTSGVAGVTMRTTCFQRECTDACPTCADTTCTDAMQDCEDPNEADTSLGDWVCKCRAPSTGQNNGAPAACIINECTYTCASCAGTTCSDQGQNCDDPNTADSSTGDWTCNCVAPATGQGAQAAADPCTIDECTYACASCAGTTCADAQQDCLDPDTDANALMDWSCVCRGVPGSAVMMPADCRLDECTYTCPTCADTECSDANQDCTDTDTQQMSLNNWQCTCRAPATGAPGDNAAANCIIDECTYTCATCARTTCSDASQTCFDPNKAEMSLSDWTCDCPPPSLGSATAMAATCVLDECVKTCPTCAGTTCSGASPTQDCTDPDTSRMATGDWYCSCIAPATGMDMVGAAATCVIDECTYTCGTCAGMTCTGAMPEQTCTDGDIAADSLDDWICECVMPYTGAAATGQSAVCILDECTAMCPSCAGTTCTDAMQPCADKNPKYDSLRDWECSCPPPYKTVGGGGGMVAHCEVDECTETAPECTTCARTTCSDVGQTCNDPDFHSDHLDDWVCTCPTPSQGTATAQPAVCRIDECTEMDAACGTCSKMTCQAQGQTCNDPDTHADVLSDWTCTCPDPYTGVGTAMAAACTVEECEKRGGTDTCTTARQMCVDPDISVDNDWYCECPAPSVGTTVGGPATCTLNECMDQTCDSCAKMECASQSPPQDCNEPDDSADSLNDWECVCVAPATGSALGHKATCILDECAYTCQSCAGMTCSGANPAQDCNDPSKTENDLNDWTCTCHSPASGSAVAMAAMCTIDECTNQLCDTCDKDHVCDAAHQECVDPNTDALSTSDWECRCKAPSQGVQVTMPATCTIDECTEMNCDTCAKGVCMSAMPVMQTCNDPDTSADVLNDWECTCTAPAVGVGNARAATCVLDECEATCASCETDVCSNAGQTCNDPNTAEDSLSDWTCTCLMPTLGQETAMAAVCRVNECTEPLCDTCEKEQCEGIGQTCDEPNDLASSLSDWVCTCPMPQSGTATAMVATCTLDECDATCPSCAEGVCAAEGQTCNDPDLDPRVTGDWTCTCPPPAEGIGYGAPGVCHLNECEKMCPSCDVNQVCDQNGQMCFDQSDLAASLNDWECQCQPPESGTPVQRMAADCRIDECTEFSCATCSKRACTDVGQTCDDPDTRPTALSDWTCTCAPPSSGVGMQMPGTCTLDECTATCTTCAGTTCADAMPDAQSCNDPDTSPSVTGDWTCICPAPSSGQATAAAAVCDFDECEVTCASCENDLCSSAMIPQQCNDPSPTAPSQGDWVCNCVAPAVGQATVARAVCEIDECNAACGTCAGTTCSAVWQDCNDPNTAEASTSDWTCSCVAPRGGSAVAMEAMCTIDECKATCPTCAGTTCSDAMPAQTCNDPDTSAGPSTSSLSDWTCVCVAPTSGQAVTSVAPCTLDECSADCSTNDCGTVVCANANQDCDDPNINSMSRNDFSCDCRAPMTGTAVNAVATCYIDECRETCITCAGTTCTDAGQSCTDPDTLSTSTNDWSCVCPPPSVGTRLSAPATCVLDECVQNCATCAGATCSADMQDCSDLDTSPTVLSDWKCLCPAPATGAAVAMAATCVIDECTYTCPTCAGDTCTSSNAKKQPQTCTDPDTSSGSLSDWICECVAPETGAPARAAEAVCTLNECTATCNSCAGTACADMNQPCTDPEPYFYAKYTWACTCKPPFQTMGGQAMAARCEIDECVETDSRCQTCARQTCSDAQQTCNDPNVLQDSLADWTCTCAVPFSGQATAAAAMCQLDECVEEDPACMMCERGLCETEMQDCVDPDTLTTAQGDWECRCRAPTTGKTVAGVAACTIDECASTCPTCVGTVCDDADQTCVDPDTSSKSLSDWVCWCKAPSQGEQTRAAAACVIDECVERDVRCTTCAKTLCEDRQQTCSDPDTSSTSLSDWVCTCPAPSSGFAVAARADCKLDECEVLDAACTTCAFDTCISAGQDCVDADTDALSTGNWRCECAAPTKGSAVGMAAQCQIDECMETCDTCAGTTCTGADQTCNDPNTMAESRMDWMCACKAPLSGTKMLQAAECVLDECSAAPCDTCELDLCARFGQECSDPNTAPTSLSDWKCWCTAPSVGNATTEVAQCLLDECDAMCATCEESACAVEGQDCSDPNTSPASLSDWMCWCREPSTGSATAAAAVCTLDECTADCPSCEKDLCSGQGQACSDPDMSTTVLSDWMCWCAAPTTGSEVGRVAVCTLDECAEWWLVDRAAVCKTCANDTCTVAGQECEDPDTMATSTRDWMCKCQAPYTGQATAAAATCTLDECTAECFTCEADLCSAAGQVCEDEDTGARALANWMCKCELPAQGSAVKSVAQCVIDECTTLCMSCENQLTCSVGGQICVDANTSATSLWDWACQCIAPKTGTNVRELASCQIDECTADCDTCADQACRSRAQDCVDENQGEASLRDWECRCVAPQSGSAMAEAAACVLDECFHDCQTCAEGVCAVAGQTCKDLDTLAESLSDWVCICNAPFYGQTTRAVSECMIDECAAQCDTCDVQKVCAGAGQACEDPDQRRTALLDWFCTCQGVATGRQLTAIATCRIDECGQTCDTCAGDTCEKAGQDCIDEDKDEGSLGDWYCRCPRPLTGQTVPRSATACVLDECTAVCQTCANGECDRNTPPQDCEDPQQGPKSLSDWVCKCAAPGQGLGVATRAVCVADECEVECPTCENGACTASSSNYECADPDINLRSLRDWECRCLAPLTGSARGSVPTCALDECTALCPSCEKDVCSDEGQRCRDTNTGVQSLYDWECACIAPATGASVAVPAQCKLDECREDCPTCAGTICADAGQECVDTDLDNIGGWMCRCRAPANGTAFAQPVASCTLDECTIRCSHCENGECVRAGQRCEDPDKRTSSVSDWECMCITPAEGAQVRGVATCMLDECVADCSTCANGVCTDAQQVCEDPVRTADGVGDWVCACAAPAVGTAVARAADCATPEPDAELNSAAVTEGGGMSEPNREAIKTGAAVATGASLLGSVFGGVAAAPVVAVVTECTLNGRYDELPWFFDPLGLTVADSRAIGTVVGDGLIVFTVGWVSAALTSLVCKATASSVIAMNRQAYFTRFPSPLLFAFGLFHLPLSQAGFSLVLYPEGMGHVIVGAVAVLLVVGVPVCIMRIVNNNVPSQGYYFLDPDAVRMGKVERWINGKGEWVAAHKDALFTHRMAAVIRTFTTEQVWFSFPTFMASALLGLALAIRPSTWVACGNVKIFMAAVLFVLVGLILYKSPYNKTRDNFLLCVVGVFTGVAAIVMAVSYYQETPNGNLFDLAGVALWGALIALIIKVLLDMYSEFQKYRTQRRNRLQQAAWGRQGSDLPTPGLKELDPLGLARDGSSKERLLEDVKPMQSSGMLDVSLIEDEDALRDRSSASDLRMDVTPPAPPMGSPQGQSLRRPSGLRQGSSPVLGGALGSPTQPEPTRSFGRLVSGNTSMLSVGMYSPSSRSPMQQSMNRPPASRHPRSLLRLGGSAADPAASSLASPSTPDRASARKMMQERRASNMSRF